MLEVQSEQLDEQRKLTNLQTPVLELRAAELRESLTSANAKQSSASAMRNNAEGPRRRRYSCGKNTMLTIPASARLCVSSGAPTPPRTRTRRTPVTSPSTRPGLSMFPQPSAVTASGPRRPAWPVPAGPHRTPSHGDTDHAPALSDVQLAPPGQPTGRRLDLVHQRPPVLRPRRPGRSGAADSGGPGAQPDLHGRQRTGYAAVGVFGCGRVRPSGVLAGRTYRAASGPVIVAAWDCWGI